MSREDLVLVARKLLLGAGYTRFRRNLHLLSAVAIAVGTCTAYAVDLFTISGGVLVVPVYATVVGLVVAGGIGYQSSGLIFAWTFFFATYLGFRANWALFELSGRSLSGKLAYFFDPVGLAVFGILAAFLGLLAYGTGSLVHRGLSRLRRVQLLGDS